jgi:hypothetical protein
MAIRYLPTDLIKKIAPTKKVENLISSGASLNKSALSFVDDIDFLDKKAVTKVALKTIKGYKKRIKEDPDIKSDLIDDPAQLVQRVQNEVVFQVKEAIATEYAGEFYVWLPSDADEPDPEHQLKYGKKFQIGVGEMPGDRFGCRCGMEILVREKTLNLEG